MKLALIAPTSLLEHTRLGNMHFILAQEVLANDTYRKFYAKERKFKLMDNGAYEKKALSSDKILEAAALVKADEVVAPDFPNAPPSKTLVETQNFLSVAPRHLKVMGVPHGRTVAEYCKCFCDMSELEVNSVGISILDLWKFFGFHRMRPMIVAFLCKNCSKHFNMKEKHLLGLDEPIELYCYEGMNIRSVDTSLPFSLAFYGMSNLLVPDTHDRIPDNGSLVNSYQKALLAEHIVQLTAICESV